MVSRSDVHVSRSDVHGSRSDVHGFKVGRSWFHAPIFFLRMGLPASVNFKGQTGPAVQKMLGNAMHMHCVGHTVGIAFLVRAGLLRGS